VNRKNYLHFRFVIAPALLGAAIALSGACSPSSDVGPSGGSGAGGPGAGGSSSSGVDDLCGDGIINNGEKCDDGNTDDTDGCDTNCLRTNDNGFCGDGTPAGTEECDDGNDSNDDACVEGCKTAYCGDGFVNAGVEDCDDGNDVDDDSCSNACTAAASGCGNGKVDGTEECDDGNSSNADNCVEGCLNATCGDGYAQLDVEECDDGNDIDDDNCTNDCHLGANLNFGCPGTAVQVTKTADVTVTGDTSASTGGYEASCGGGAAKEVVYAVTPSDAGTLVVTMTGLMGVDPVLYARSGSCDGGQELACSDMDFTVGGTETFTIPVQANATYWVFADGYDATEGPFSLKFHLQTTVDGDACPGSAVSVSPGNDVSLSGNTSVASSSGGVSYKGTTGTPCEAGASTKDIVYAVTPSVDGTLYVSLDPSYDGMVYARSGSCTTGTQLDCSEMAGVGGLEVISFPVTGGTKYSVFVDGKSGDSGAYNIDFHLQ